MPPNAAIVQQYLDSKKFIKARDWYSQDFSKYEPYIIQHDKQPKFLFCKLTRQMIPKIPQVSQLDGSISLRTF